MLKINKLSISFLQHKEYHDVVKNSSFELIKNEILGIVGESGSGKSVTSLALLGLLPKKTAKVTGEIIFNEEN